MNDPIQPIVKAETKLVESAVRRRENIAHRFPLAFGLATTFGFVSTLYGFEKLIDKIDFFTNNPWTLLATGILTLVITGVAYKKLN